MTMVTSRTAWMLIISTAVGSLLQVLIGKTVLVEFLAIKHQGATTTSSIELNGMLNNDRLVAAADSSSSNDKRSGKFAYAFVVSGCTDRSCTGYVLNALVNAKILKDHNTTADIVFKVQMTTGRLPEEQEQWLSKAGILLEYIKPGKVQNFGQAVLQKFRILTMAKYDRVLFLDSDIMVYCNMDYMFHESYNKDGLLQEQVAVAGAAAPATASIFMVTPKAGEFEKIIDLVRQHRNRPANATVFDRQIGWGYKIVHPDHWEAWRKTGPDWNFYASNADQGLLYHWFRYLQMNYTHIHQNRIETWRDVTWIPNANYSTMFPVGDKLLARVNEVPTSSLKACSPPESARPWFSRVAPWMDHYHFAGGRKPWNGDVRLSDVSDTPGEKEWKEQWLWRHNLRLADVTFSLGLPAVINTTKGNPFGGMSFDQDLLQPDAELPSRRRF